MSQSPQEKAAEDVRAEILIRNRIRHAKALASITENLNRLQAEISRRRRQEKNARLNLERADDEMTRECPRNRVYLVDGSPWIITNDCNLMELTLSGAIEAGVLDDG